MRAACAVVVLLALTGCAPRPNERGETKEEKKSESKLLEMTTPAQQHVGLKTVRVAAKDLQEYLHVVGTVQPIDTRIGHIRPLAPRACAGDSGSRGRQSESR